MLAYHRFDYSVRIEALTQSVKPQKNVSQIKSLMKQDDFAPQTGYMYKRQVRSVLEYASSICDVNVSTEEQRTVKCAIYDFPICPERGKTLKCRGSHKEQLCYD